MTTTTHLEHGKSAAADFDPANYTYVTSGYNWSCGEEYADYVDACLPDYTEDESNAIWQAYIQEPASGLYGKGRGGKCQHCGKHLHWFVLFRDIRTGNLLVTGTTCAEELELPDKGSLIRKELGERVARLTKLAKIDARFPGLRQEIERVVHADRPDRAYFFSFLSDLCGKINRYLDISDRQAETAKRFLNQGLDRIEECEAKRGAEQPAQPIPEAYIGQRVRIRGVVLGIKEYEREAFHQSRWGSNTEIVRKMLVQSVEGFKVWGTNVLGERGSVVEFYARIEASKDDPTFGFFSRPTKARLVEVCEGVINWES